MTEVVTVTHTNTVVDTTQPTTVVNVTDNGWFSKINWTQGIQALCAVLVIATGGKLNITPDQQLNLVGAILVIGNIITVIQKTYFTPTVTKQSIATK